MAQTPRQSQTLQSIGVGPFEFPIAGTFVFSREGGATIIETADGARRFTVAFFRHTVAGSNSESELAVKPETIIRRSWLRFVEDEKGKIVKPFSSYVTEAGLLILSMATEFVVNGVTQYYVQFAVVDGGRIATIFAEGLGSALSVTSELEPLINRTKVHGG